VHVRLVKNKVIAVTTVGVCVEVSEDVRHGKRASALLAQSECFSYDQPLP